MYFPPGSDFEAQCSVTTHRSGLQRIPPRTCDTGGVRWGRRRVCGAPPRS